MELTDKYTKNYFLDFDRLNVKRATEYPKASDHIQDMQNLISDLISKEYAYVTKKGIYFSVFKISQVWKIIWKK